jgi:hypothetical protein
MPTIAQLTAENDRLTRVVEQAIEAGALALHEQEIFTQADERWRGSSANYPDLYAQLKGEDGNG